MCQRLVTGRCVRNIVCCYSLKISDPNNEAERAGTDPIRPLEVHDMFSSNHVTMKGNWICMKFECIIGESVKCPLPQRKLFAFVNKRLKKGIESFGAFGPGMIARGRIFESFVCSSGGKLKLIAIIGHQVVLPLHWHLKTWNPSVIIPSATSC